MKGHPMEEMIARLAQRMIGQTVGFEDQFGTDQVFTEFGMTPECLGHEESIHFGAFVDVGLLLGEDGELYYQVTFIDAGEEVEQ